MSYEQLKHYQDINSLQMKPSWTRCTVGLEHSVSGKFYWLSSVVRFYAEDKLDHLVLLGGGEKNDSKVLFSTIEAHGFNQVNRRVMREWEYYDFKRIPNPESSPEDIG